MHELTLLYGVVDKVGEVGRDSRERDTVKSMKTINVVAANRYYCLAGIVFTLSDFTGLLRLQLMDNKYTYVVTTFIYFAAFFMLCISVFSIQRKEVVTWNDLFTRYLSDLSVTRTGTAQAILTASVPNWTT